MRAEGEKGEGGEKRSGEEKAWSGRSRSSAICRSISTECRWRRAGTKEKKTNNARAGPEAVGCKNAKGDMPRTNEGKRKVQEDHSSLLKGGRTRKALGHH